MKEEGITLTRKNYRLAGLLNAESMYATPVVITCQGLLRPWDTYKYDLLRSQLEKKGIANLRFDLYGCSPRERENAESMATVIGVANLSSAVDYLEKLGYQRKMMGIFGASTGGEIALVYASKNEVGALVLREPPTHLGEMAKTIKAPTLLIHGNMLKGKKPLEQMDLNEQLNYFSVMAAKRFLANFGGTAELKLIEGADHACEDPDHIKQFVQYSTDWFAKWLKSAEINEL